MLNVKSFIVKLVLRVIINLEQLNIIILCKDHICLQVVQINLLDTVSVKNMSVKLKTNIVVINLSWFKVFVLFNSIQDVT